MTIGNRIKKLRKELDLTQQQFADRASISRNNIASYEIGRSNLGDAVVTLICREFNVNETWLRKGEGEMFAKPAAGNEQVKQWVAGIFEKGSDFERRFITALSRFDKDDWAALGRLIDKVLAEQEAVQPIIKETTLPRHIDTPEDEFDPYSEEGLTPEEIAEIDAEVAEIRRQKMLEKSTRTSTASISIASA